MKFLAIAFTGFILFLSSVWIGAYGMHNYPADIAWQSFPIFFTSFVFFIVGFGTMMFGSFKFEDFLKAQKR